MVAVAFQVLEVLTIYLRINHLRKPEAVCTLPRVSDSEIWTAVSAVSSSEFGWQTPRCEVSFSPSGVHPVFLPPENYFRL